MTHAICLAIGGIGLISIMFIHDKNALIFSMVCVGIAWASILAMPYAILSGSLNIRKIGVYMGIFNFFITFPQLVNGVFGGPIVKYVFGGNPVYSLVMGGVCFILGAIAVMRVDDPDEAEEMAAGA
jgi:maltose/moltooligosaccharide transporter